MIYSCFFHLLILTTINASTNSSFLDILSPLLWKSYDSISNQIILQWTQTQDAQTYTIDYKRLNGETGTISVGAPANQAGITCLNGKDGTSINAKFKYTTLSGFESQYSIETTFLCADLPGIPSQPTVLLNTIDKVMLKWKPPVDDGGTPIIGYQLKMKPQSQSDYIIVHDGRSDPSARLLTLTSFNLSALSVGAYDVSLIAFNWVGESAPSTDLTVFIISNTSPSLTSVFGTGVAPFSAQNTVAVNITARALDNSTKATGGDIFLLRISDYCERIPSSTYYCHRVSAQHILYNRNIFNKTQLIQLADHSNGTYSSHYNSLTSGWLTTSVILATQGGLLGEYFQNIFLDGNETMSRIDSSVNFNWGSGLITDVQSDFVSIRWSGFIRGPLNESMTISVRADNGVRIYFDYELIIDAWTIPREEPFAIVEMIQDQFYQVTVEYKDEQEEANIQLFWSSFSISKEIIPSTALYYPQYVDKSPYSVHVFEGITAPHLSVVTGSGLSNGTAGMKSELSIISKDIYGGLSNITTDNYQIELKPVDGSIIGSLSFGATHQANGTYSASYIPTIS